MKYSAWAHLLNVLFIAVIFVVPIGYCLANPSIPPELGRTVVVLSFALAAFVIADWYHLYTSNTYRGALSGIGLGVGLSTVVLLLASQSSEATLTRLARLDAPSDWQGLEWLLRAYMAGIGLAAAAIVSIPRLAIIKMIDRGFLQDASDA